MTESDSTTTNFRLFFSGLLPLFVLAHFAHHVLTALPTPLLPMIRSDFALNYTQSGLLISSFSIAYGFGQLPAGWLADRIGQRILITLGISGVAFAGFLVGFSSTYISLILFFIMMGLLGGGYHPAAPALISKSVEPEALGRSLGLHIIGGSSSYFLAPLIAIAIATAWSWRGSFIALSFPTVIFGVVFFLLLGRIEKKKSKETRSNESKNMEQSVTTHYGRLIAIITLSTFASATTFAAISFIPLFLVDNFGLSENTAAALLSIVFSAGLWAAPVGGYLSDRVGKIPVILAVCFLASPVIFLFNLLPYGIGTWTLLLILGISLAVRMPVIESFLVSQTSFKNRSTVLGIYYFSAMESGGLFTPVLGYLIDKFGFHPSFSICSATLFLVALICSFWLWCIRER